TSLLMCKTEAQLGRISEGMTSSIARAYEQFEAHLTSMTNEGNGGNGEGYFVNTEPLPDRLRVAFVDPVYACVPDSTDYQIPVQRVGLVGDGEPNTLASISAQLGISRERVRQLRIRIFRKINAALSQHVISTAPLHTILMEGCANVDWKDPEIVAPLVVTN